MATQITPPTFDAAAWFTAWSDHGGLAVLTGDRLWVGRARPLDSEATQRLDALRCAIVQPGAGNALAGLLRARSGYSGEAEA